MHSFSTRRSSLALAIAVFLAAILQAVVAKPAATFDTYCVSKTCSCPAYRPLSKQEALLTPKAFGDRERLYAQLAQPAAVVNRLHVKWQVAVAQARANPNADGMKADALRSEVDDAHAAYKAALAPFAQSMDAYRRQRASAGIRETEDSLKPFTVAAGAAAGRTPVAVLAPPANKRGAGEFTALQQAKAGCMLGYKEAKCAANGGRVVKIEQIGN